MINRKFQIQVRKKMAKCTDRFSIDDSFIQDAFDCVICLEFPEDSPVYQCENGHVLCSSCHARVVNCPTCRVKLRRIRCLAAEKVLAKFGKPCKYNIQGCKVRLSHDSLETHEARCGFRRVKCPFPSCKDTVTIAKIVRHIERWSHTHEVLKADVSEDTIIWGPIKEVILSRGSKKLGLVRFMLDDIYFLSICWRNLALEGRWFICIYCISEVNDKENFEFTAKIKNNYSGEEHIYSGPCIDLSLDREHVEKNEKCLSFNDATAKRLCEDDKITVNFEIRRAAYLVDV